ncbi:MAG: 50S ribosomal protein L18 [Candidatus Kerfeldbacteria bacterium]|nr:50S ribosomal protein L18 [Candidatus Kerfeldbacteria bacterium]
MKSTPREKLFRRKSRIRSRITGTAERPRLSVHRSLRHVRAQLIDDVKGVTIVSASDNDLEKNNAQKPVDTAKAVGKLLAEKAKGAKIERAVFDRGGRLYHGRVRAVAEGARRAGLQF